MAGQIARPVTALCRDCFTLFDAAERCPACGSRRTVAHPELTGLSIAHVDCDAFYASVEKRDRPELADRPVIVGGGVRGVVTTCCYIARLSGVRSAMPMFKARRLCPEAEIIRPDFPRYRAESRRIMAILATLTPLVQPLSLDEAWLDLSGADRLHGAPAAVTLAKAQARIAAETGLGVSVGLAANKFLAKIASDLDKPRGFAVIGAGDAQGRLAAHRVSILPGVGPVFAAALERAGYRTVGDLAAAAPAALATAFGDSGARLARLARGEDDRAVLATTARKSISAETTFETDLHRLADLEDRLWPLCEKVARIARAEGLAGRTVTLKLRRPDFRLITRRRTLPAPTQTARTLFAETRALLRAEAGAGGYRLIGAGLSDLAGETSGAGELFGDRDARALIAERAMDGLKARFGPGAVVSGRSLR